MEIAITHCGICGSDLHTAFGGWGDVEYPIITGHEIVGTIRRKGASVTDFAVGDRVGVGAQCHACLNTQGKQCRGCGSGNENHCEVDRVDTYNGRFQDGQRSQGGYADAYRCDKNFVFRIPDSIPSHLAAPLLCAGATTYSPLVRHGAGPNKKVGIVGLGGLGHLAVQFASKLGSKEVVVFSHSQSKADIARKLGATAVVDINDEAQASKYEAQLDIVLVCGNAKGMPWELYLKVTHTHTTTNSALSLRPLREPFCSLTLCFSLVRLPAVTLPASVIPPQLVAFNGIFCSVALPEEPVPLPLKPMNVKRIQFVGSLIGSLSEIKEMLAFCAKNDVLPMVEVLPMSEVNEGIRKVREGDVKFRVVLQN